MKRHCDSCGAVLRGKGHAFVSDDGKTIKCAGSHIKPNGWTGMGCPVPWPK